MAATIPAWWRVKTVECRLNFFSRIFFMLVSFFRSHLQMISGPAALGIFAAANAAAPGAGAS